MLLPFFFMTWFIVASGPSLTREDVASLEGQRVIVINDNYVLAPWADVLYACDGHWWDWHAERAELKAFKGRKITRDADAAKRYGLEYIRSIQAEGLSSNPDVICENQMSGAQAINLAAHFLRGEQERRIVLLGFDMQQKDGRDHWHDPHPFGQSMTWWRRVGLFDAIASDAKQMGVEIVNCTRETALKCFPRAPLASLLTGCVISA